MLSDLLSDQLSSKKEEDNDPGSTLVLKKLSGSFKMSTI